jgi:hypothetical protein
MEAKTLPVSKSEIAVLPLEWPRLDADTASGCPVAIREVVRYVAAETGARPELRFARTARIGSVCFWVWWFASPSGEAFYADVSNNGRESLLGMGSGAALSVPQYLALRYVRVWRK